MITIGYSTRKHNPEYKEYLQKTCMYKQVQIIEKINNGEKSLSEVYNEIIEESTNDIIVLCHDDIEFDTNRWGDKLLKHFDKQTEYGIFGLAGSKYLPTNGQWWYVPQTMFGIVNHKQDGKKWTSTYSKDINNKVEEVVLVDGLFIAFDKTKIKHKFDETIEGFHFYDLGFSVPNHIDGVKVGVIFDIRVTHLSVGQTNEKWEENRKQFVEKYKPNLPIDINSKDISQTFIFVHDQDLIITFEENNKFSNLYNYKYVFLGNRPVDKLSTMDNVIIVRDLEYNIEQYPLFTSYTGWYALWKNNLITTQYINLFEYDVVLDNNIEQNHAKFYYNNVEMIGYVPFLVSNSQFIQNPNWNHAIIPSIKKHYKIDIVNHYVGIMKQNQNALWSSTSNTTFRTDIFNEYMKWFQPIVEDIKETKTCGHAHERSISFFASIKRKQLILTNNLLQHLQLDSHKTQGHFVDQEKQIETLIGKNTVNYDDIKLITFATGKYVKPRDILIDFVKNNTPIKNTISYGVEDLPQSFLEDGKEVFSFPRGFGYWVWKPYLILKTLLESNDNDIVLYVDSTDMPKIKLIDFIKDHFTTNNILLFKQHYSHDEWTKRDCFILMDCDDSKYHNITQLEAGVLAIQKTEFNIKFIKEWLNYCLNKQIVTDLPNIKGLPNHPMFKEHRHDQSILTNLSIKYNIPSYQFNNEFILYNYGELQQLVHI